MLLISLQDCWVQQYAFVKQPSHIEYNVLLHMQLNQSLHLHLHPCWECCAEVTIDGRRLPALESCSLTQ